MGRARAVRAVSRAMFLVHNVIVHPICGVLWFLGADRAGDWLHRITAEA